MRAARVRAPGSSPSHLGPPKARISGLVWARRAVRIMSITAGGGSSINEFAGAAPRRPKTCPNATQNARAFRSHSPADFVRAGDPARARITSISGTLATRRRRVGGFCPPPFKGFAFMASPSSGGPKPRPQKGTLRCPIYYKLYRPLLW